MSRNTKFKKSISLLFIFNLSVWIVLGSKLENPDWKMWIDTDDGQLNNKRITAKSVFVAPLISKCSDGYKLDALGRCVKIASINHTNQWKFLLDKLNSMFATTPSKNNSEVVVSEPWKLNIPINNNIIHEGPPFDNETVPPPPLPPPVHASNLDNSNNTSNSVTNIFEELMKITETTTQMNTKKHELTTRKQPEFTNMLDLFQTTSFTGKQEYPTYSTDSQDSIKTGSTKPFQESTTMNDKYETFMWITEKPKKKQDAINRTQATTTSSYLQTNFELNNLTRRDNENLTTVMFGTPTLPLVDKYATTPPLVDKHETTLPLDAPGELNIESTYPSSTPSDFKTTFTMNEPFNKSETDELPNKFDTTVPTQNMFTSTTDSPFLIIVTDTNNHIVNNSSNETDYILISNSSSSNVNKLKQHLEEDVNKNEKIVEKIVCIDGTEFCNDEIVLPYFESTKTIRNDNNMKPVINKTNDGVEEDSKSKPLESSKIIQILKQNLNELQIPSASSHADFSKAKLGSPSNDKLVVDSSHIYESLKMPPPTLPPALSKLMNKVETSSVQSMTTHQLYNNIMQPTSKLYTSTPVYSPKKSTTTQRSAVSQRLPQRTTQRSPVLTTTKRIYTHPSSSQQMKPNSGSGNADEPNMFKPNIDLMYSLQPNVDFSPNDYSLQPNSNDYLYGSSSSNEQFGLRPSSSVVSNSDYTTYDTSAFVRFPNDQPAASGGGKQYPNSKFSLDFQNTFGSSDSQQNSGSNSFIRFPTISRTPASTFNSWSNTRWPPHPQQASQYGGNDGSWNSRWPPHQQQQQQYYNNQNSRYHHPITNYKLLQI